MSFSELNRQYTNENYRNRHNAFDATTINYQYSFHLIISKNILTYALPYRTMIRYRIQQGQNKMRLAALMTQQQHKQNRNKGQDKMSEIFSKRLKKIREEKKLSQADLAKKADLQTAAISHFETGKRKPSFDNLKRLVNALNVSVDYLLGREMKDAGDIAEKLFRNFEKLSTDDQQRIKDFAEFLAQKDKEQK